MKKILLLLLLCINLHGFAQNKAWILAPKYAINNGLLFGPQINLPTTPSGYQAQPAKGAQNIITNADDEIMFFIVDDYIYDRNGNIIEVFGLGSPNNEPYAIGFNAEISVIKDPLDCNVFHLLSTGPVSGIQTSRAYYAKLRVSYDSQGQLNANSGFYYADIEDCESHIQSIESMVGDAFNSTSGGQGNPHDELASFAVAPPNSNGVQKIYIINDKKIFRFNLSAYAFTYDNDFIDLESVFSSYVNVVEPPGRNEFEVVKLPTGNYRLAFFLRYIDGTHKFAPSTVDLDPNGVLIANSQKTCQYEMTGLLNGSNGTISKLTGLEFSPNGEKLYVSHAPYNVDNSTLDYWNLTTLTPTRTVLSTNVEFQTSQIEAAFDGSLMIPRQNYLAKISNPNGIATINETAIAISSYNNSSTNSMNSVRLLQDQVDGDDYSTISPAVYNAFVYNATTSGQWLPNTVANSYNNNPLIYGFGSVVQIEKELRVKAGTTLTIENMTFKFSPGARVVVENGTGSQQGGKLILKNTTFTNNDNCVGNDLWLGVEVWGNQSLPQISINNTTQGRLTMLNSTIENASVGVLVSKRKSILGGVALYNTFCGTNTSDLIEVVQPFSFDNARNGGIVQTSNSTFLNNQRGAWFLPYIAFNGANNLSHFYKSDFIWNDAILTSVQSQLQFQKVKGISIKGCNIENNTTIGNNAQGGFGINARESQFYVTPYCNSPIPYGQTCPSAIPNVFKNLNFGIRTTNSNDWTFKCLENSFINNRYGVYVIGTKLERIEQNKFQIRETPMYQCAGISVRNSTGYFIQENELSEFDDPSVPIGTGNSYGIVVNNSGELTNEVYKNYFHDLKVGGQTEHVNAVEITASNQPGGNFNMKGLRWNCNDFRSNIENHDMTLMRGRMHYYQGQPTTSGTFLETKRNAANNKFSLTGEPFNDAHDIYVSDYSQNFSYSYIDATHHVPDSYTVINNISSNVVDINQILFGGAPIYDDANTCPSKISGKFTLSSFSVIGGLKEQEEDLYAQIDNNKTNELLALIENGSNGQVKNGLLNASPYLSDEVLIQYINSNPPNGHLKQVLIANSNLSNAVKEVLVSYSMPNGTANQIADAQEGTSARSDLYAQISNVQHKMNMEYNDLISQTMLNDSDTATIEPLIAILKEYGDYERLKSVLSIYITMDDTSRAQTAKQELLAMNACPYFIELTDIQAEISSKELAKKVLINNPSLETRLSTLVANSDDEQVKETAQCILNYRYDIEETPDFLTDVNNKSFVSERTNSEIDLHRAFNVSIYPNPTTGIVNFDFPNETNGELEIEFIGVDGRVRETYKFSDTNSEQININELDKGYYLIRIKIDGQLLETQKLELF